MATATIPGHSSCWYYDFEWPLQQTLAQASCLYYDFEWSLQQPLSILVVGIMILSGHCNKPWPRLVRAVGRKWFACIVYCTRKPLSFTFVTRDKLLWWEGQPKPCFLTRGKLSQLFRGSWDNLNYLLLFVTT